MANIKRNDIHPDIRALLDESGAVWRTEVGSKHIKVFVTPDDGGDRLVHISPRGGKSRSASDGHAKRSSLNSLSQVRRKLNEILSGKASKRDGA